MIASEESVFPSSSSAPCLEQTHWLSTYHSFYQVERWGVKTLSDHGGPFGFDIHAALLVDYLIRAHGCDGVLETGSHLGDTTVYLAGRYPELPVVSCDINSTYTRLVERRTRGFSNVSVETLDSRKMLQRWLGRFRRPFIYLDAHWSESWPLKDEIELIQSAVVCIDDFNVGHPRFAFDVYDGVECGPALLLPFQDRISHYYVPRPNADYPYPCLQTGRRGGKAFIELGLSLRAMERHEWFEQKENAFSVGR